MEPQQQEAASQPQAEQGKKSISSVGKAVLAFGGAKKEQQPDSKRLAQSYSPKSFRSPRLVLPKLELKYSQLKIVVPTALQLEHEDTASRRLKRFLLRYYPPGIILEYELRDGTREMKEIDLLHLTAESDVEVLVNQIVFEEPLISESRKPQLRRLIYKLIEKLEVNDSSDFYLFKILRAHILPLTNCAFNKSGDKFITGSYDRTCKVWDTQTGDELLTLEGHKNVVYAIAFNNPYGDKIITGSFDKTCKLWSAETGQLYHTYRGHSTEIVCLSFNPQGTVIATGSMDNTAKLWDVETGQELHTLFGHTAEIVSLNFDTQGERIITGSFDHTVKVWDVRSGRCIHTLAGHHGEISSTQFNYTGELCISGSIDRTCKIWDVASGQNIQTLRGHNDEILDVSFNATGSKLVTASADGTSRIYNTMTGACQAILIGHEAEISKVCFNPQGSKVLTASMTVGGGASSSWRVGNVTEEAGMWLLWKPGRRGGGAGHM
ncbi:hypothetical protein P43SY_009650 [Pythium insidiosum]|uniref:WD domain-containing protein n=1 Tax=Pythium insidiosum TaxID=114742 RepID=A0AAD5Q6A3_PYTIN|nr:hypothetical protein P43SY_009650 [Pythium insidiosum]